MALATALKSLFLLLDILIFSLLLYTLKIDPFDNFFREITYSPWLVATTVDAYSILLPIGLWISYKESHWILAALRIIPLLCLSSIFSCGYILIQLVALSPGESMKDPIFHVLLSKKGKQRSNGILSIVSARVLFITLGFLIFGTYAYAAIIDGSPFRSGIFTPMLTMILVDSYSNSIIASVWIAYKEQSWISAGLWIVLLMCFRSVVLYAYIVVQLFRLSPQDPLFLILFKDRAWNENEGSIEALI